MNFIEQNINTLKEENYILKAAASSDYWFGLTESKLLTLIEKKEFDFSIIIYGSSSEGDFYIIPYTLIALALTKKHFQIVEIGNAGLAISNIIS